MTFKPLRFAPLFQCHRRGVWVGGAALTLMAGPLGARAATFQVDSASAISAALQVAQPGDTLVMANGVWNNQSISFATSRGSDTNPITLRAATPGGVILTGTSTLEISGNNLVVDGLHFRDGNAADAGHVVQFRGDQGHATNSRLTNTVIESYNPADVSTRYHWVSLYGENNRVDHNRFLNQDHSGVTVVAWLDGGEAAHRIDSNQFADRPEGNDNGFESIRIGTSSQSDTVANVVVENNVFERADGEIEIISNKSTGNTYQYNTFRESAGTLTLRHGHDASVEGNFFLGEGKERSGGIRVVGEEHRVINNYIADVDDRADGAISISAGVVDTPATGYEQVKNAVIAHNTIVNVQGAAVTFDHGLGSSDRTLLAENVTLAGNLIHSTAEPLFEGEQGQGWIYQDNLVFGAALGIPSQPGVTVADPKLELGADGLWRPAADSPAIDGVTGSGFTTVDFDGQARIGLLDIGADERSTAQIVRKPLASGDVGADWFNYVDPDGNTSAGPTVSSGPYAVLEAEHATQITDPDNDGEVWTVASRADASNGQVLASGDGARSDAGAHETLALYDVAFGAANTYTAYYLARGFSTSTDSFFVPEDFAQDPTQAESTASNGVFRWESGGGFTITESNVDVPLEFRLGRREALTELDALIFHPSSSLGALQLDALLSTPNATLGDLNHDGQTTSQDLAGVPGGFEAELYGRNTTYNPAADVNFDGSVDNLDLYGLEGVLIDTGVDQATQDAYNAVLRRRGDVNQSAGTDAADIDFLFAQVGTNPSEDAAAWLLDLDVDGAITRSDVDTLVRTVFKTAYGDLNLDGDVDVSDFDFGTFTEKGDLLTLSSNLNTTSGAGWSDGDLNGDGDVDVSDFDFATFTEQGDLLTLASNLGFSSVVPNQLSAAVSFSLEAAEEADALSSTALTYDPATGELFLTLAQDLVAAAVVSELGLLDVAALDSETELGNAIEAHATTVSFANTGEGLPGGTFNLGQLLEAGLSLEDLGNVGVSFGGFGTPNAFLAVTLVPEPGTAGLLLTLGALAVRRRRPVA